MKSSLVYGFLINEADASMFQLIRQTEASFRSRDERFSVYAIKKQFLSERKNVRLMQEATSAAN